MIIVIPCLLCKLYNFKYNYVGGISRSRHKKICMSNMIWLSDLCSAKLRHFLKLNLFLNAIASYFNYLIKTFLWLNRTVDRLWSITEDLNILYKENWTRLAAQEVQIFQVSSLKYKQYYICLIYTSNLMK